MIEGVFCFRVNQRPVVIISVMAVQVVDRNEMKTAQGGGQDGVERHGDDVFAQALQMGLRTLGFSKKLVPDKDGLGHTQQKRVMQLALGWLGGIAYTEGGEGELT